MIEPLPLHVAASHAQWRKRFENEARIDLAKLPVSQRQELAQWQENAKDWRHMAESQPLSALHYLKFADECDSRYLLRLGQFFLSHV